MKIQKIFLILAVCLLMLTLTGVSGVMAQSLDNSKSSCCPGGKPASECTPAEKASCQAKCDSKDLCQNTDCEEPCDPSKCSTTCEVKKDDSGT